MAITSEDRARRPRGGALGALQVWSLAIGDERDASAGIGPVLEIHRDAARERRRVFCAA